MRGFNVLHPFGWDAFGQPAENAAIKEGIPPDKFTYDSIANMKRQLQRVGLSYDWQREIASCDPAYYRWNQWFFTRMWAKGMLYRKLAPVNWCPKEEISLSNEQASGGVCWRCHTPVIQKELSHYHAAQLDRPQPGRPGYFQDCRRGFVDRHIHDQDRYNIWRQCDHPGARTPTAGRGDPRQA
jgi:leucyl-tRNA synthetase